MHYMWKENINLVCKTTNEKLKGINSPRKLPLSYKDNSNSTWLLVGRLLFCMQDLPCSVRFWCILGGSEEVWMENIWFELTFACQEVLKWVWPASSTETKLGYSSSSFKFQNFLRKCTTSGKKSIDQPMENYGGPTTEENSQWATQW